MTLVGLAAAAGMVLSSCTTTAPKLDISGDQADLVGTWKDANGHPLPDGTNGSDAILAVQALPGSTTCDDTHVTVFMSIAWPPGTRLDWNKGGAEDHYYRYVRDTAGALVGVDGQSDLDTKLPLNAGSTGINRKGNAIYAVAADPSSIWVSRPNGTIERWTNLPPGEGCPS